MSWNNIGKVKGSRVISMPQGHRFWKLQERANQRRTEKGLANSLQRLWRLPCQHWLRRRPAHCHSWLQRFLPFQSPTCLQAQQCQIWWSRLQQKSHHQSSAGLRCWRYSWFKEGTSLVLDKGVRNLWYGIAVSRYWCIKFSSGMQRRSYQSRIWYTLRHPHDRSHCSWGSPAVFIRFRISPCIIIDNRSLGLPQSLDMQLLLQQTVESDLGQRLCSKEILLSFLSSSITYSVDTSAWLFTSSAW